jgi:hypothetical protein
MSIADVAENFMLFRRRSMLSQQPGLRAAIRVSIWHGAKEGFATLLAARMGGSSVVGRRGHSGCLKYGAHEKFIFLYYKRV